MADISEWKKLATTLLHEEPELTHRERAERCGVSVEAMKRFSKDQAKVATSEGATPAASQKGFTSADPSDQLYTAAELGDLKLVELLIPQASDLNWRYKDGSTALWISSRRGHRKIAKRLLIEPTVRVDNTSLHGSGNVLHVWSGKEMEEVELMQLALKKGADVNEVDEHNQTPLFLAAKRGHAGTVQLLMEWGADPSIRQGGSNALPFTAAAGMGHLGVLRVLYEFSSCVNPIPYADGLFLAAKENQTATVCALVETWGANPNVVSTLKMTPIFVAASKGHEETVSVLMKAGAIDSVFVPGEVDQGIILGSALEIFAFDRGVTSLEALLAILDTMIPPPPRTGSKTKNATEIKQEKMVVMAGMSEIRDALNEAFNYQGKHTSACSKKKTTAELFPTLYRAPKLVSDPVIFCTKPRKASKPQGAAALQNGSGNENDEEATTSTNTSGAGRAGGGCRTVGTGRSVSFLSESESAGAGLTSESATSSGNEALKTGEKEKAPAYYERATLLELSEENCVLAASSRGLSTAEKYHQDHLRSINAIDDTVVLDVDKELDWNKKAVEMFRKELQRDREAAAEMGQLVTRRPPSLHDEYLGLQKISGADFPTSAMSASIRAWCAKSFERGYWNSCLQPWLLSSGLKEGVPSTIDEQLIARRFGGVVKAKVARNWLESQKPPLKYGQIIRYEHDVELREFHMYKNTQRSSYSNNPNKPVLLEFGNTHVAVGFNDLRILANGIYSNSVSEGAEFQASRTNGSVTSGSGTTPDYDTSSTCSGRVPVQLRFVGLDCSSYAVAKCLAIAEMLEIAGQTVPEHVLQVWYSAAWSKGATKTFKAAVGAALAKRNARMQQTDTGRSKTHLSGFETASDRESVRNYLEFWAHADAPSLQQAREEWVKTYHGNNAHEQRFEPSRTMGCICSMSRKKDRQAVSRYMVSGDVFWTEKPAAQDLVGSMTNYAVPASSPHLDEDLIFNAVGWDELIARFESGSNETTDSVSSDSVAAGAPGNSKKSFKLKAVTKTASMRRRAKPHTSATPHTDTDPDDIVRQTTQLLYEQIQNLHRLVQAKRIAIELNCVTVSADNVALQQAIRAIRPHTISWSNVLDYFAAPSQFHKTARACSTTDEKTEGAVTTETCTSTRHYGYSMNWPELTFGTHLMDYPPRKRKTILDLSEEMDSGKWNNLGMCSKEDEGAYAAADAGSAQVVASAKVQAVIRGRMIYPPFDSPFNTTGWILTNRYAKSWVDYFFEGEEVQLHETGGIPYQPLMNSANTSVNFSWTYNCTQRALGKNAFFSLRHCVVCHLLIFLSKLLAYFSFHT